MNSHKTELLVNRGNTLAWNQKAPSAQEPCVISLAISQYLPQLYDQDMATTQRLAWNDRDRNSGRKEMQSQLGKRFDVNQGVRLLQQACPLWQGLFCPFGGTPGRKLLLRKILHLFWSSKAVKGLHHIYLTGCLWKGEDKCWMYTTKPVAVDVSACCYWHDVLGQLPLSLQVSLLGVGVMRNLHIGTKFIIYYKKEIIPSFLITFL